MTTKARDEHSIWLGKTIKEMRKEKHFTQIDFSLASGISQPMLSRIERGISLPKEPLLRRFSELLETSVESINARVSESGDWILCSAIHVNDGETRPHQRVDAGMLFCGYRHADILAQVVLAYPDGVWRKMYVQGFLTRRGKFVDCEEAMIIARRTGQTESKSRTLYSEDLY